MSAPEFFTPCDAMLIDPSDEVYLTDCTLAAGHDGTHSDGFFEWSTDGGVTVIL